MPRLKAMYEDEIRPALTEEFGYRNAMMIPRVTKVTLNIGVGDAVKDSKKARVAADALTLIAGQQAVVTRARISVATFRLRAGMVIGAKVTLRGARMYEFLDRLITVALPRVRDFRGLSPKSFDGNGNFSLGLREHIVFPEIEYNTVQAILGMEVSIGTAARSDAEARSLRARMNMPFRQ